VCCKFAGYARVGIIYKTYRREGGKRFGPYYYTTVRTRHGRTKSVYLGSSREEALKRQAKLNSRQGGRQKTRIPRFWIFAVPIILIAAAFAAQVLTANDLQISGNVLDAQPPHPDNAASGGASPAGAVPAGAVQQPAVIGEPVKWIKKAPASAVTGMAAAGSERTGENVFYTEAPEATEQQVDGSRKLITISSPVHYANVKAYTAISPEAPASSVRLYHINSASGAREPVEFKPIDANSNGLADRIEWLVPHLSSETYELVIEVTKAEHLDASRHFVSDVYPQVSARDGSWSEPVPDGHYVRATFRKNLTREGDITIYARSGTVMVNGTAVPYDIYLAKKRIDEIRGILGA